MKKILVTLFAVLLMVNVVYADDVNVTGGANSNVTVGEVEGATPVYDVTVSWSDLVFDWTFNNTYNRYQWSIPERCTGVTIQVKSAEDLQTHQYFSDSACTTPATTFDANATYYVKTNLDGPEIDIIDNSVNGTVEPAIAFTPSNGYDFTSFKYHPLQCNSYNNENDLTRLTMSGDGYINGLRIGGTAGDYNYHTVCETETKNRYNVSLEILTGSYNNVTPHTNDVIGTITISFDTN